MENCDIEYCQGETLSGFKQMTLYRPFKDVFIKNPVDCLSWRKKKLMVIPLLTKKQFELFKSHTCRFADLNKNFAGVAMTKLLQIA